MEEASSYEKRLFWVEWSVWISSRLRLKRGKEGVVLFCTLLSLEF